MMDIESPAEARRIIRAGDYAGHTAGVAPDYVQGNLCILPKDMALEFAAFCQRNPKPCPLIGMGAPGDPSLPDLGDIDIRTDVPRYRVFKDGKLVEEPTDIRKYWIGRPRHLRARVLVLLRAAVAAGRHPAAAHRAQHRGAHVPHQHRLRAGRPLQGQDGGVDAPLHAGGRHPGGADHLALSGRAWRAGAPGPAARRSASRDIDKPDLGDPAEIRDGELPVFWACGVTPQVVIEAARPSICITHKPGSMLITDKRNASLAAL